MGRLARQVRSERHDACRFRSAAGTWTSFKGFYSANAELGALVDGERTSNRCADWADLQNKVSKQNRTCAGQILGKSREKEKPALLVSNAPFREERKQALR